MTTTFYTAVTWLPPTPRGLLPGKWVTSHRCSRCGERVPTAELVSHAEGHGPEPVNDEVP